MDYWSSGSGRGRGQEGLFVMKLALAKLKILVISVAVAALAGCADAEFSGNGDKRGADNGNSGTPTNSDTIPTSDNPGNGGTTGEGTLPGGGAGGNGTDGKGFNFGDWFGWGGNGFDVEFSKPLTVWHVGDNDYSATNCKIRVSFNRIDGREFNFNFYVEQNNTQVGISIYHCGVDPGFQNTATLLGPQGNLGTVPLVESDNLLFLKRQNWNQPVTLNQGWHKLKVVTSFKQANNDWDDYVVGKVKLVAPTGPIRLGEVTKN